MSLEDNIRRERHERIGKAIMMMTRWQRFWWGLTGRCEYMTYAYWEKNDGR